jgi:hypothetical protein
MRWIVTLSVACALLGASLVAAEPSAETSLRVAFWEGPADTPDVVSTLRCNPPGGSLSRPAVACRKLAGGGPRLFAPVRPDAVCTEIYGGPQRARVTGLLAGKHVWATFTRTNGCNISRWNRLSPWLLPPGGVT